MGNRNGNIDTNATVTVAEAIPIERRNVGPQQATPVRSAGTADRTLCEGLILHILRAEYVYADTETLAPTNAEVITPNTILGIARKIVMAPNDMKPIGSQLNGVRSLRIKEGQDSEMNKLRSPCPENVIILVTTK
jgi:hypothetical protein